MEPDRPVLVDFGGTGVPVTGAVRKHPLVAFFVLAFALTWANWVPQVLVSRGVLSGSVPPSIGLLAGYGPALAAIIVTSITAGRLGLRRLFGRILRWRVGLRWYAIAALTPVAITVAAIGLNVLAGGAPPDFAQTQFRLLPPGAPLWQEVALLLLFFTLGFDGIGEELGWRAFAQPRLQASRSALQAALILGVLWAAWHIPFALMPGGLFSKTPWPLFVVSVLSLSVIHAWLFNGTQGSALIPLLFHAVGNTPSNALSILPPSTGDLRTVWIAIGLQAAFAGLIVLVGGPATLARRQLTGLAIEPPADISPGSDA